MKRRTKIALAVVAAFACTTGAAAAVGRPPSTHAVTPSDLGGTSRASELERLVDVPGPITAETVVAADWAVDREGLLNLAAPAATRRAGSTSSTRASSAPSTAAIRRSPRLVR